MKHKKSKACKRKEPTSIMDREKITIEYAQKDFPNETHNEKDIIAIVTSKRF